MANSASLHSAHMTSSSIFYGKGVSVRLLDTVLKLAGGFAAGMINVWHRVVYNFI